MKPDKHKEEEATFNYLAPDFSFLRATRAAQTFMKNAVEYGQGDVDRLNAMVDEGKERGVPTVSLTLYDGDFEAFARAGGDVERW